MTTPANKDSRPTTLSPLAIAVALGAAAGAWWVWEILKGITQ